MAHLLLLRESWTCFLPGCGWVRDASESSDLVCADVDVDLLQTLACLQLLCTLLGHDVAAPHAAGRARHAVLG